MILFGQVKRFCLNNIITTLKPAQNQQSLKTLGIEYPVNHDGIIEINIEQNIDAMLYGKNAKKLPVYGN